MDNSRMLLRAPPSPPGVRHLTEGTHDREWVPLNADHAIDQVAVTVRYRQPIPEKLLATLITNLGSVASATKINEEFVQPFQVGLQIGIGGVHSNQIPLQVGRAFRRTQDSRVVEEITCNGLSMSYSARIYSRWDEFIEQADRCLKVAIDDVVKTVHIEEVKLEYLDIFQRRSPNDSGGHGVRDIINPNSKIVPKYYNSVTGPWHCHAGFFHENEGDSRTLVNINITSAQNVPGLPEVLPQGVHGQVNIYTAASAQFVAPDAGFNSWGEVRKVASEQHSLLKSVLGDVINPGLSQRMNLKANQFGSS
jgi:uncharacterized protein (TIGR04255 family)